MSIPTSRLAYSDCYEAMDRALDDTTGVRIKMESHDGATFLRMRFHQARAIDRKDNMAVYEDGDALYGRSIYDPLVLRIREDDDNVWLYIEKIQIRGLVQPLSEIEEYEALPVPAQPRLIEQAPAPLQLEHIKRRI